MNYKPNHWVVLLCLVAALAGVIVWETFERRHCTYFKYINRDYACGQKQYIAKGGYISLKNSISNFITKEIEKGSIKGVSVYFRDLRDGPVMGINELENFAPASLMKLPLTLAFFHMDEELYPDILETKIAYKKTHSVQTPLLVQNESSHAELKEEEMYTIEELLRNTIVYSDNDAYFTLIDYINSLPGGPQQVLETFQEIGIVDPRTPEEEVVSVRSYASLFRLLYNASYLSIQNSDQVLSWLSASEFNNGLSAGVPETIKVANKFGERGFENGDKLLHDCGVVYYPRNPYSLCIAVRGNSYPEMARLIADISKSVYEEVHSRRNF